MKDDLNDLNEDKQISKTTKGRKRGKRIEDSESEQSDEMKKNSLKKRKYSNDEIESEKETEKYPQEEKLNYKKNSNLFLIKSEKKENMNIISKKFLKI